MQAQMASHQQQQQQKLLSGVQRAVV